MNRFNDVLFKTSIWVSAAACAAAISSPAAAQTKAFDIPAQSARTALPAFAKQADVQILAPATALQDQNTSGVVGRYSVDQGLKKLISGTRLAVASNDGHTITLHSGGNIELASNAPMMAAAVSSAAQDTQAAAESGTSLEEVVVTARKVEENLQRIPVAVTAFTAADLKARSVQNFSDLQYSTPSLTMETSSTGSSSPLIQLRGQTQSTFQFVVDPNVGLYVDGVYNTATFGLKGEGLLDTERVEVLKGPQGTLYGKNTTGGALSIYTKLPTDTYEGEVRVGLGNYDRRVADAVVNVPIIPGKVALRVSGLYETHDGYGTNTFNGRPLNDQDDRTIRAALKIDPTDKFEIIIRGDAGRSRTSGILTQPVYAELGLTANLEAVAENFGAANVANPAARAQALALYNAQAAAARANPYKASLNDPEGTASDVAGGSVTMSYDFGDFVVKSITAYRTVVDIRQYDVDATSVLHLAGLSETKINQFTQEFQLSGHALNDRLKYTGGFFYYKVAATDSAYTQAFPALTGNGFTLATPRIHNKSPAFYGQASYEVIPNVNLTAGLRWTHERKEIDNISYSGKTRTVDGTDIISSACSLGLPVGSPCTIHFAYPNKNVSYNFAIDWSITPDVLVYARTSRGYKSGFYNQAATAAPVTQFAVLPEKVTDYEAGVKSQWLDNRLRVNADYYHTEYRNIQKTVQKEFPPGSGVLNRITSNAAAATIDGVEVEATAIISSQIRVVASGAYTKPKYTQFFDGANPLTGFPGYDESFQRFLGVSKWTYNLSGVYTQPVSFGQVQAQVDWSWRSNVDLSPADGPGTLRGTVPGAGTPDAFRIQPSYGLLNASATATFDQYKLDLKVYVKNLTKQKYDSFLIGLVNGGVGTTSATPGDPRTYGVDLTWHF